MRWRPHHSVLRTLYHLGSHNRPSRVVGHLADVRLPPPVLRRLIAAYIAAWKVRMSDFEVPPGGFRTLDEFFTRRLRPGARTIGSEPVVSPCDGRVQAAGVVHGGTLVQAKGRSYALADLLGNESLAARLEGGHFLSIYLSPRDYHRVHVPLDGELLAWRHLPGVLFSVAPRATLLVDRVMTRNERFVLEMRHSSGREAAMVMVGAANVGRITSAFCDATTNRGRSFGEQRLDPPVPIRRGEEAGVFHLGSTVVLVVGPGPSLVQRVQVGQAVLLGQGLFTAE